MRLDELPYLEVILTAGCNLRCSYCYQTEKKARSMEWRTLRAALDLLVASTRNDVGVLFIGGEPLLEFPSIERAVAYVEATKRPEMTVRYEIITNGMLLRDEHLVLLEAHDFEVQLSFDGLPALQDLRGPGTFTHLDRLLDHLRAVNPGYFARKVKVSQTLLPHTISRFPDSVAYFLSKDVRDIRISPALTATPEWRPDRIAELDGAFEAVFDLSVRHYRRTGHVPLAPFWNTGRADRAAAGAVPMCGVSEGHKLAVDVDGEAIGCVMFAKSYQTFPTKFLRSRIEALGMGGIDEPGLRESVAAYPTAVRATGLFHDKRTKFSSYGRCSECRYLSTCGFCPVSIGHQPGNDNPDRVPDFLCAYNLVTNKYRERFPKMSAPMESLLRLVPVPELAPAVAELLFG